MGKQNIPWSIIKTEYLQGLGPSMLGEKYNVKKEIISQRIQKEGWVREKKAFEESIKDEVKNKIAATVDPKIEKVSELTDLALQRLEDILNNAENIRTTDLIQAIGKVLDISGLKCSKQEHSGPNGEPLGAKKIFVTRVDEVNVNNHIDQMINDKVIEAKPING